MKIAIVGTGIAGLVAAHLLHREHEIAVYERRGAIPYQRNEAVLHTDISLLPRRRAAWSSWNFHLTEEPVGRTTVTYWMNWMNNLQRLRSDRQFLLTLNRGEEIDPGKVLRRIAYDHPVYTAEGVSAQARDGEISGVHNTHYCGAYWGWGFHEDGVLSALRGLRADRARLGGRKGAGGMTASAVYEGWIRHRRYEPIEHGFR
jgi:predicted NAD/FAD-binding protein